MFKSKKDILKKITRKDEMDELNELKSQPDTENESGGDDVMDTPDNDLKTKINELTDKLLRKAAEFENYKRRTENEISSHYKYANEKLIIDLLPILGDFERLNSTWNEKHDVEKYKEGIELIYEKLKKVLKQHEVKEIDSVGKPFDVNLHEAVLQMPKADVEPNTVVDELEKGYYLKDKVIKHSKVIVSSPPNSPLSKGD